jgi:hypothetical protein
VRACVPEKNFPGATPPDPQGRGKRQEGEGREGKGVQREGGEGRKGREGKEGKGIRARREGIGPPPMFDTDRRPWSGSHLGQQKRTHFMSK